MKLCNHTWSINTLQLNYIIWQFFSVRSCLLCARSSGLFGVCALLPAAGSDGLSRSCACDCTAGEDYCVWWYSSLCRTRDDVSGDVNCCSVAVLSSLFVLSVFWSLLSLSTAILAHKQKGKTWIVIFAVNHLCPKLQ